MGRKLISRKKFLTAAVTGIAGMRLMNRQVMAGSGKEVILREIGKTGIKVSPVCFGVSRTNEESLIKYAVDKGFNFIDTGRSYGNGNNELLVGRALSGIRDRIVIQSKLRLDPNEAPSDGKGKKGADEIKNTFISKLEASLKALNTSYIDILLYHDATSGNLLFHPETIKFFTGLKKSGVIKAFGFSTHNDKMDLVERNNNLKIYDVVMIPFNHKGAFTHSVNGRYSEWDQEKLVGILREAAKEKIGIIAMKTCSGGPYAASSEEIPGFAEAVRWVLKNEFISSAAVAMTNFEEVNEHAGLLTDI